MSSQETIDTPEKREAFLIVQNGPMKGERYRLAPGLIVTMGRATTNRIIISDEICSRTHCELFQVGGSWTIRDCGSRNGTRVDNERISRDRELESGNVVQLGTTVLQFNYQNDEASRDPTSADTATDIPVVVAPPEILHRTAQTSYGEQRVGRDRASQELARLYRLALQMGAAANMESLSEVVLEGLFASTSAEIGAVLVAGGQRREAEPTVKSLVVAAFHSKGEATSKVSNYISELVLAEKEAVLARDISIDEVLSERDSLGEIAASSLICAPIRFEGTTLGLIHLYATNPENPLTKEDLDFVLAVADQLAVAFESLRQKEQLVSVLAQKESENRILREQLYLETELIGDSDAINHLREKILRIAPTGATSLIRGESGVGKELVARAIHTNSNRRSGPFITMNCAALSESLLESELFGHEKGSFTGAVQRKIGKFEQANGGTIFLDEVGEMSPSIQAKFLRVLEGHPYERLGGGSEIKVDVRVVAATNRDLELSVEQGQFRRDLYFRLQVVEIFVEPLRERREDVAALARFFLDRFARKSGRAVTGFDPAAITMLEDYDWPGNVRELQNTIERAVILCPGPIIVPDDIHLSSLGLSRHQVESQIEALDSEYRAQPLEEVEMKHILATLESTNWNKSQAAHILGIERSTLDRKLKRYDVDRPRR